MRILRGTSGRLSLLFVIVRFVLEIACGLLAILSTGLHVRGDLTVLLLLRRIDFKIVVCSGGPSLTMHLTAWDKRSRVRAHLLEEVRLVSMARSSSLKWRELRARLVHFLLASCLLVPLQVLLLLCLGLIEVGEHVLICAEASHCLGLLDLIEGDTARVLATIRIVFVMRASGLGVRLLIEHRLLVEQLESLIQLLVLLLNLLAIGVDLLELFRELGQAL